MIVNLLKDPITYNGTTYPAAATPCSYGSSVASSTTKGGLPVKKYDMDHYQSSFCGWRQLEIGKRIVVSYLGYGNSDFWFAI